MENMSKIPMYITLKQLNKSNNVRTELVKIKVNNKFSNLKKFELLSCAYDIIECLMNINEAA